MSAQVSQALNEPDDAKRLYVWKDFHKKFIASPVGQVLNAERCLLVPEDPKDYTKEVKIVLPKNEKAADKVSPAKGLTEKLLKPLQIVRAANRGSAGK